MTLLLLRIAKVSSGMRSHVTTILACPSYYLYGRSGDFMLLVRACVIERYRHRYNERNEDWSPGLNSVLSLNKRTRVGPSSMDIFGWFRVYVSYVMSWFDLLF